MNRYIVRRGDEGSGWLFWLIHMVRISKHCVVIAFDSRNSSEAFAEEAALTLCGAGINVILFKELAPTPVLSFAVRHLNCIVGIVITASHNPKEYNG